MYNESQQPIFVISSGRTGSTLLARIISSHPELLCISDLIEPVGHVPYFDPSLELDGRDFFKILSAPSFPQRVAYWRDQANAELLYLPERDDRVSLLLCYAIPFIYEDPMAAYARIEAAVSQFPKRKMTQQVTAFFDWLRNDIPGKRFWVERTGGSLPHTREMIAAWPHGKFVHNYRDPRETAISMMTGSFFRLYLELEKNPQMGEWDWTVFPPIEEMGAMLNRQIRAAEAAFSQLPDQQFYRLRFEDLMSNTYQTLLNLVRFLFEREPGAVDKQWAEAQVSRIRQPRIKFGTLSQRDQKALAAAVEEGRSLLGYS